MSYPRRINRIFKSAGGDAEVQRKRSDGRMKTYDSATDLRAWSDLSEDRRQHILDLVKKGGGKGIYFGKYIPFEAIINILVANKNATIKRLQQENNELKRLKKGQTSSSSGTKLQGQTSSSSGAKMQGQTSSSSVDAKLQGQTSSSSGGAKMQGQTSSSSGGAKMQGQTSSSSGAKMQGQTSSSSGDAKLQGQTSSSSGGAKMQGQTSNSSGGAKMQGQTSSSSGGAKMQGQTSSSSGGAKMQGQTSGSSGAKDQGQTSSSSPAKDQGQISSSLRANDQEQTSSPSGKLPRKKSVTIVAPVKPRSQRKESELGASDQAAERALKIHSNKSASDTDGGTNVEDMTAPDNRYSSTSSNVDNDNYYESDDSSAYSPKESEEILSQNLAGSRMTEKDLKDALKEQEKICRLQYDDAVTAIEQLENIKNIVESEPRLSTTQRRQESSSPVASKYDLDSQTCTNEIDMLEKEIKAMENSSSHEQEVIQRELQVLKKMCEKLTLLQKENSELRRDQKLLEEGLPATVDDALKEKLEKLKQVTSERDRWKARVQKLEQKVSDTNNLQDDSDSKLNMRERYMDFRRRLDSVEGVDDEVKKLKEYASRIHQAGDSKDKEDLIAKNNELQQELNNLRLKLQEIEALQADNDSLKKRAEGLSKAEDHETLSSKAKDFDTLLAERDNYKSQYENLECENEKLRIKLQKAGDLEDYYKHLSSKMGNFDKIEAERDIYKSRCENLECECENLRINLRKADESEHERRLLLREIEDCECYMSNQENEIKRLIGHVGCLTRELNEREQRSLPPAMVEAFSSFSYLPQAVMLSPPCQKRFTPAQTTLSQPHIQQSPLEQSACSIKRIVELENTLLVKQKQTKQKIDSLQYSLEKFKRELELEKQKNSDLMSRYTNQSRTVTNMSIEIQIVRRESCQDKERLKHLNTVLNNILRNNTCQCPPERETSAAIDAMMGSSSGPHPNEESNRVGIYITANKHNRMKKTPSCHCKGRDSDSFEIDE